MNNVRNVQSCVVKGQWKNLYTKTKFIRDNHFKQWKKKSFKACWCSII